MIADECLLLFTTRWIYFLVLHIKTILRNQLLNTTHGAMLTISTSAYYAYCIFLITHSFFAIIIIKDLLTGYCSGALFSHYAVVNKAEHVCDRSQHYIIVYVVMNAEKHNISIKVYATLKDPHFKSILQRKHWKAAKSS